MYLVMQVYADDEYASGANSCAIELTSANIKYMLDKIELAKQLKQNDSDFYALEFWYSASWSENSVECEGDGEAEIADKFEESEDLRIDCETLNVTDTGVQIKAYLKNTSVNQNAESLSEEHLKKMYKALTCPKDKVALLVGDEDEVIKGIVKARCAKGE